MSGAYTTPYALTPDQARRAIAVLMKDGRERTVEDIHTRTGIPELQLRQATRWLIANGALKRTRIHDLKVYRKAPAGAHQEA